MNGMHDLGGMHGFGPIVREENEPVFHHDWERSVRAILTATRGAGIFNLDQLRYAIESLPPARYLEASYYERWVDAITNVLIEQGVVDQQTLAERASGPASSAPLPAFEPIPPPAVAPAPADPRFAVGARVRTRLIAHRGHTRLPRYAQGKPGVIHRVAGPQLFPDASAARREYRREWVYTVSFDGRDLWGAGAEPGLRVSLECWESYLEPED